MTSDQSRRLAAWAFGAYVVLAWVLTTFVFARHNWFAVDDWDFLSHRRAGSAHDLLTPYNGHWSTVPILVLKGEYRLFGLRYWPYVGVVMAMHLCVAVLLRALMRRAGVNPWLATVVAALFVLYGPGNDNLVWSFQVGMVGSLLAGLLQLWLATREEPVAWSDALAVVIGALGLMTSGASVVMVVAVGVAVLLLRGWRAAAVQVVPLAVLYGAWYLAYGRDGTDVASGNVLAWLWDGLVGTFEGLGHWALPGAALAVTLVAGAVVIGSRASAEGWSSVRTRTSAAIGLLLGAITFQLVTALTRSEQAVAAKSTRYIHVTTALVLVAVGVALDELFARRRWTLLGVIAVLLVPIVANISLVGDATPFAVATVRHDRLLISALPDSPLARRIPPRSVPARLFFGKPGPPIGWLLVAKRAGRIPDQGPAERDPALVHEVRVRLTVIQFGHGFGGLIGGRPPSTKGFSCRTYRDELRLRVRKGDRIGMLTGLSVRFAGDPPSSAVRYSTDGGWLLRVVAQRADLLLGATAADGTFRVCLPR